MSSYRSNLRAENAQLRAELDQLHTALESRIIIEQAKGIVAQRDHVDVDAAFQTIRQFARNRNLTLRVVCGTLVRLVAWDPGLCRPGDRIAGRRLLTPTRIKLTFDE